MVKKQLVLPDKPSAKIRGPRVSPILAAALAAAARLNDAVSERQKMIRMAQAEGESIVFEQKRLRLYQPGQALTCPSRPCD